MDKPRVIEIAICGLNEVDVREGEKRTGPLTFGELLEHLAGRLMSRDWHGYQMLTDQEFNDRWRIPPANPFTQTPADPSTVADSVTAIDLDTD